MQRVAWNSRSSATARSSCWVFPWARQLKSSGDSSRGRGTRGQRDKGTEGQGDKGTRGQGDKGTRGQGDKGTEGGRVLKRATRQHTCNNYAYIDSLSFDLDPIPNL